MSDNVPQHPAGWDELFKNGVFPPRYKTYAPPNASVVDWTDTLPEQATVLDVGCGVGRHVVYLGGRGFNMSGADIAPSGVQTTRDACAERGIPFNGRVADMTALPWDDNTFDAVLSTATVCHHCRADITQTLAEIFRVLKPDGLVLVDFLHKETQSYQEVLAQVVEGKLSEVEPDTFVDASVRPDLMDDAFLPHHYTDETEVRELMGRFELLRVYPDLAATSAGELPKRGYWVAWARKPST
jgi:SAM-dependent methyltransferase